MRGRHTSPSQTGDAKCWDTCPPPFEASQDIVYSGSVDGADQILIFAIFLMMRPNKMDRPINRPTSRGTVSGESGIVNENILLLVFRSLKCDLHMLCILASVSQKLRAIAKRLLWRELCVYRAPRMLAALTHGATNRQIEGGWHGLAKLMFFCCGCQSTRNFRLSRSSPGHFVKSSRFSKTSGRSFLARKCRSDLLFVSDPCEHQIGEDEDDLGIYRGVFRGFRRSKTRALLIGRQVELEERVRCPYCGARVWSMTTAKLVPKSAARRLGSHDGRLEYFVCLNGHLHGTSWLVPLSSDEDAAADEEEEEDGYGDDSDVDDRQKREGSTFSTGEEIVATGEAV